MKKYKNKYEKTKTLKVNENNDIDSIIEIFQRFGNKYNVITTTLDPDIQYQTKNIKITQTYTSTISKTDLNKMIEKLKKQGFKEKNQSFKWLRQCYRKKDSTERYVQNLG